MALVRRVKSFSVRKNRGLDDEDREKPIINKKGNNTQFGRTQRLERRKSISLENVKLCADMRQSTLFQKQQAKLQQLEEANNEEKRRSESDENRNAQTNEKPVPKMRNVVQQIMKEHSTITGKSVKERRNMLQKRISMSLDEATFQRIGINREDIRQKDYFGRDGGSEVTNKVKTISIVRELMTSFEGQNTNGNQITREPKFPTDELEGVEVRQRTTPQRPTRSKTLNFDSPRTQRKPEPGFELKGPMKIKTPEMCVKIRSNQKLRYFDNQLQILSESKSKMEILVLDLKFQRNTISMINKKEVEMKDTYYKNYIFHFDNSKDAKHFYEQEKNLFNERTPIKTMLKRLLGMRSSRDLLESKGILKNEQIFGNTLQNVYGVTNDIPEFIKRIIELIERPENIKSTGLYRTSGNLATIQKIRLEVDNGKLEILEEFKDDVDVLTGSLKLFFRELKELVIPEEIYYRLIKVTENESTETTTDIINSLPASNREVLLYLLAHLVKVYEHKESNRMDIYNLAVCWGPSLIGISNSGADLVSQATQVSKVMEHLITYQKTLSEARKSPRKSFRKQISKESLSGKIPEVKVYDFVYEVVKKLTELIERNINVEGIYKKSGSEEKKRVILRKIDQRQINDLDHLKLEVHDICSALKKYLLQLPEPLIPTSLQNEDCDNPNEEQLRSHLDQIPKKDALILLLRHISKVQKHNNMSKSYIIDYWTATLIKDAEKQKIKKCSKLLEILITLMEPKPLPDLIQEQNRIRESTYDNVDREATFLDEKTEEAVGTRL